MPRLHRIRQNLYGGIHSVALGGRRCRRRLGAVQEIQHDLLRGIGIQVESDFRILALLIAHANGQLLGAIALVVQPDGDLLAGRYVAEIENDFISGAGLACRGRGGRGGGPAAGLKCAFELLEGLLRIGHAARLQGLSEGVEILLAVGAGKRIAVGKRAALAERLDRGELLLGVRQIAILQILPELLQITLPRLKVRLQLLVKRT
jgi:hypothetical protein